MGIPHIYDLVTLSLTNGSNWVDDTLWIYIYIYIYIYVTIQFCVYVDMKIIVTDSFELSQP